MKAQVELEQPASPSANLGLWTGVCGGVGLILADPHSNLLGLDNVEGPVEEGRDGVEAFQASVEKNVSITDMFKGAAASRCRPVVCVGDSILRIDMVDVQGWSGNQVRRLLDGNVGSTVTLTNWSKQRAVSYTVTMTRSHVPCITSSGNKPQLYALDVVTRIQDLFDDLLSLSHALSKERDGFEEHKLQARAAQEELKMVLTTAVDEADELRGTNASLQKALEVQTEVISAYKREIYDAKDQCSLLQGQLREADDDMQEQQKSCLQLHNHVQDVEDRMQQAVVDNRKLSMRLVSKVRKGALSRALSGFKHAAIAQGVAHQVSPSVSQPVDALDYACILANLAFSSSSPFSPALSVSPLSDSGFVTDERKGDRHSKAQHADTCGEARRVQGARCCGSAQVKISQDARKCSRMERPRKNSTQV